MLNTGPIVVIEDDADDIIFFQESFRSLNCPNKIIFFSNGFAALDFIREAEVKPFLIISDINMPMLNGYEVRRLILNSTDVKIKCIPYLFFTTGEHKHGVYDAFSMCAQGYFIKPNSMSQFQNKIRIILEYWNEGLSPV